MRSASSRVNKAARTSVGFMLMSPVRHKSLHLLSSSVRISGPNGPEYEMTAARMRASPGRFF